MNQTLVDLVAAAATAELIHAVAETFSARSKVTRLDAYMHDLPYQEMRPRVDTPVKAYGFAATAFVVLFGVSFTVFSIIQPPGSGVLWYLLIVLLVTYAGSLIGFDRFHSEIGALTRPFIKK